MLRQDYIGRLIQQLLEALARITRRVDAQELDEARAELDAQERALGVAVGVERLTARSVAMLLGGGDKVVLYALLLEQRAKLAEHADDPELARSLRARALELVASCQPFELADQARELTARLGGV